jgi:hypothetical protein
MEGDHTNSQTKSYLFLAELGQGVRPQSHTTEAKAHKKIEGASIQFLHPKNHERTQRG